MIAPDGKSATPRKDGILADVTVLLIGLGGFAGAISRYMLDGFVTDRTGGSFPWGTLAVNASGAFVLGFLFAVATERAIVPAEIRAPPMIGYIGAYTTFSTYLLESWRLVEGGAWTLAAINIVGSVTIGMVALLAGLWLGRAV